MTPRSFQGFVTFSLSHMQNPGFTILEILNSNSNNVLAELWPKGFMYLAFLCS